MSTMLYRPGGNVDIWGQVYDTKVVIDADELEQSLIDGWKESPQEVDELDTSRGDLEAQATALGITFKRNISDAALQQRIDDALQAAMNGDVD